MSCAATGLERSCYRQSREWAFGRARARAGQAGQTEDEYNDTRQKEITEELSSR